jgi:hypothetical protein
MAVSGQLHSHGKSPLYLKGKRAYGLQKGPNMVTNRKTMTPAKNQSVIIQQVVSHTE